MDTHLWTRSKTRALRLSQESGEAHVEEDEQSIDPAPKRHCSITTWTANQTAAEVEVDVGLDVVEEEEDTNGQTGTDKEKAAVEEDASSGRTDNGEDEVVPVTEIHDDDDTQPVEPALYELEDRAVSSNAANTCPVEDVISSSTNMRRKRSHVEMESGSENTPSERIRLGELAALPSPISESESNAPARDQGDSTSDDIPGLAETRSPNLEQTFPPSLSSTQAPPQDENTKVKEQEKEEESDAGLHQTIVLTNKVEHDETSMLQDFLDRVRAGKASKKNIQAEPSSETKRAVGQHLSTPLQALDVNSRSPSRSPSPEKTIKLQIAPAAETSKARKKGTSRSNRAGADPATPSAVASRRSQRQRQAASSARPTCAGGASMIPVRRLGQARPVRLVDSAANELAALTKANTKRNRIETQPDKSAEVMDSAPDRIIRAASRKKVVWDEQLVYYEEKRDQEQACEVPQASNGRQLRSRT